MRVNAWQFFMIIKWNKLVTDHSETFQKVLCAFLAMLAQTVEKEA